MMWARSLPDTFSFVLAQMCLDLAVLNSNCPVHDTLTGEKVSKT